jgi:hypothetical protein
VKAWLTYAAVGAVVTLAGAGLGSLLAPTGAVGAVWFAAALAYGVQLVAFAALVAVRSHNELFLVGWLGGLVLRFAALVVVAIWLARTPVFPRAAALVSLASFVFVLLMLEPLFLRRGLQTR